MHEMDKAPLEPAFSTTSDDLEIEATLAVMYSAMEDIPIKLAIETNSKDKAEY